jgi:two-component system chemotaxis response regulator CheY
MAARIAGREPAGLSCRVMTALSKNEVEAAVRALSVLIIDDSQFMRRIVRNCLLNVGVKNVFEAADGIAGLEAIRTILPDIVVLDWELPLLNGAELARIVRSPGVFPVPNVPIIMLSSYGERWRVVEASRIGINEYLVKPISAKALFDRMVAILAKPRPIVQMGKYYGPQPRRPMTNQDADQDGEMASTRASENAVLI